METGIQLAQIGDCGFARIEADDVELVRFVLIGSNRLKSSLLVAFRVLIFIRFCFLVSRRALM